MLPKKISTEDTFKELLLRDSNELRMGEWLSEERHSLLRFIDQSILEQTFRRDIRISRTELQYRTPDPDFKEHIERKLIQQIVDDLMYKLVQSGSFMFHEHEDPLSRDVFISCQLDIGVIHNLPRFKEEMEQAVKELTDDYEDL